MLIGAIRLFVWGSASRDERPDERVHHFGHPVGVVHRLAAVQTAAGANRRSGQRRDALRPHQQVVDAGRRSIGDGLVLLLGRDSAFIDGSSRF